MKLARLTTPLGPQWAAVTESGFRAVNWSGGWPTMAVESLTHGLLLPPVDPPMIIGIGLNYRKHAEETGAKLPEFPVVFAKFPRSLVATETPIVLPRHLRSDKVDYEAELGFVLSRDAKNVKRADALDYILGFTAANDVSARDWQKEWGGGQWSRAKSFDTFCPVGPYLVTLDELPNYNDLRITSRINDEMMQDSTTGDLIFDVPTLLEFLTGSTTLPAGTLVLTGTPSGVGMARTPKRWLQPGDMVEVEIEGIGVLRNPVVEEV
jgi:2-keto-4-pentenoate hydratase/2-oxohepta-3-ene-1,7-dioic acid hydratase in catechol pathway